MKGHCKLCNNEAKLEESHIIPKFIFRWIKKTSATGYLRFAGNPNKREQDGIKEYWLCGDCEDRLEKWETVFSQEIFHPYVRDSSKRLGYGEWMLKFSTSLTWRALTYIRDIHGIDHFNEELMDQANQAEVTWRKFLLGEIPHPGKFQQHIIPLDVIDSHTVPNLPPNMNRYILRATDYRRSY